MYYLQGVLKAKSGFHQQLTVILLQASTLVSQIVSGYFKGNSHDRK